jgi:hypothetical protein
VSPTFSFVTASQGMLSGGSFRNTPLTDEFTFRDYLATHGDQATPIFLVEGRRLVGVFSADSSLSPSAGQTVVSLITPSTPEPPTVDEEEMNEVMDKTGPRGAGT